jgi:hypothetical protein
VPDKAILQFLSLKKRVPPLFPTLQKDSSFEDTTVLRTAIFA